MALCYANNIPKNTMYKCLAVAEIGDHLATIDSVRKLAAVPLFGGRSCAPSNTMWPMLLSPALVVGTKCHVDPSSHLATIDIGRKLGRLCPLFWGGELGPHLTQCRLG